MARLMADAEHRTAVRSGSDTKFPVDDPEELAAVIDSMHSALVLRVRRQFAGAGGDDGTAAHKYTPEYCLFACKCSNMSDVLDQALPVFHRTANPALGDAILTVGPLLCATRDYWQTSSTRLSELEACLQSVLQFVKDTCPQEDAEEEWLLALQTVRRQLAELRASTPVTLE